jgi:DNA-binding CsgD family transcriptional regulator
MGNCEELFEIMGVVFPNRIRAMFVDGRLMGLSGPYSFEMLDKIRLEITSSCPGHETFRDRDQPNAVVASNRHLIRVPPHPDMVVRFIHFSHRHPGPCEVLALAAGPPDTIDLLRHGRRGSMPLSRREMQLTLDLAAGRTLQEVAERDGISISTVRNQVKNAMRSTSTHSQAHLASIVRDWLL